MGENCKTKSRPGRLRPKKARKDCARQLHRIVLVKCTLLAVHCYSSHDSGFSASNIYFCMKLLIDQVIVDLLVLKVHHEMCLQKVWSKGQG